MSNKKQAAEKVFPEDKKKNLAKYPDHLKSPMHGMKDRKEVLEDAKEDN